MYQIKFTLKQHTPIIHFQHGQVGATLRATEVKPKLDRFIYNQWLKEKNNDAEVVFKTFGHLTVGYTVDKMKKEIEKYDKMDDAKKKKYLENFKWALDYKVRILQIGTPKYTELINVSQITDNYGNTKLKFENLGGYFGNMMKVEEFQAGKSYKKVSFYDTIDLTISSERLSLINKIKAAKNEFLA